MSLRITMVTGSLSRRAGGVFQSVSQLSLALLARGHQVRVIGLHDPDTEADLSAWAPIEPIVLDTYGPPRLGLANGIKNHLTGSDIVHQHGIWQLLSYPVSCFATSGHTVVSPHGMLDPWARDNGYLKKRIAWAGWERTNLRRAACIHALAEAEAEAIRDWLPEAPLVVIPNGIGTDLQLPQQRSGGENTRICLFMARIHPKKGIDRLLNQWASLPNRTRADWRLEIAGPDEVGLRAALEEQAISLGLRKEVSFVGPLTGEAKAAALARASAFVLPSHSEGLPMSVLEAWSSALPVLMTRACNLPEGFEAKAAHEISDDPADLARGLARADLAQMGLRGRNLVERRFGWDMIAARHEATYEWILGHQPEFQGAAH